MAMTKRPAKRRSKLATASRGNNRRRTTALSKRRNTKRT